MINTMYVITPCRNAEETINETISSIVNQAGDFHIRYHVQDAQSSDRTISILEKWKNLLGSGNFPISCLGVEFSYRSEKDNGLYDGISKAVEYIKLKENNFMTWLNSDDLLVPGAFSTVFGIGRVFQDVNWITGKQCYLSGNHSLIYNETGPYYPTYLISKGYAENRYWTFLQQEGTFWKVDLWNSVGGLNPNLKLAGDFDLWTKFAQKELLWQYNGPLGIFRKRPGQLSENLKDYLSEIDTIVDYSWKEREWGEDLDKIVHQDELSANYKKTKILYSMDEDKFIKIIDKISIQDIPPYAYYKKYFIGWSSLGGLSYPEAYPESHYPVIQWGLGKSTILFKETKYTKKTVIIIRAKSFIANQSISIYVNKVFVKKIDIGKMEHFGRFEVNIELLRGDNTVELQYDKYSVTKNDPRQLALLYSELKIL